MSKTLKVEPVKIREEVINRLISMIAEYVQEAGNSNNRSTFMAHPNFAPSLAYIHNVINGKLFLNCDKVSVDYRMYEILRLNRLNFDQFANYFYPKLYSLGM